MSPDTVFLNSLLCSVLFQGSVRVSFFFFLVYKENLRDSRGIFEKGNYES